MTRLLAAATNIRLSGGHAAWPWRVARALEGQPLPIGNVRLLVTLERPDGSPRLERVVSAVLAGLELAGLELAGLELAQVAELAPVAKVGEETVVTIELRGAS